MASKRPLLINPKLFMDISIGGEATGRMTFEVFADQLPITSENFRALCTGETGRGYWFRPRYYKYTQFHRVIPRFMCQGGDYNCDNGYGGESIYGQFFRSEKFIYKHSRRGLLSMARGPRLHENNSEFFITFNECPWLDGKHVVFGQLLEGFNVLTKIEKEGTEGGKPQRRIEIYDCGELTKPLLRTVGQQYAKLSPQEVAERPDSIARPLDKDKGPIPKVLWLKRFLQ